MHYITSDPTRWGAGEGVPLSKDRVDDNTWETTSRLSALEASIGSANPITSVTISGTDLTFTFENGDTATLPFPVLQWNWRGDWLPSTVYATLDTFIVDSVGLFLVLIDHVSALTFDEAATSGSSPVYQKLFGFSGISATPLSDLTDVAITAVADKNFFVYDNAASKWKNVTKTVATSYLDAVVGDSGSGGTKGLVPAPGSGDAAAEKFLKADGSWAIPPGTGGSSSLAGQTDVNVSALANNDVLQYKTSDGKWHNTALASLGGTVTTVIAGTGISTGGSDITTTGTVSLASVSDLRVLANVSGASAPPTPVTLSAILDAVAGSSRGSIIRRDATGWSVLGPGTSGQYLKSGGSGADVSWDSPAGSGTVTSVAAGTGLAGGTITGSGTLSVATVADNSIVANISGSTAVPSANTLSNIIDHVIGSTRGAILYRGASGWTKLDPGTSGRVLQTNGSGADPTWAVSSSSSLAGESDVNISSPSNGQFLKYNSGSSKWVNSSVTIPAELNDLSDVNISPGNFDIFRYQTSDNKWHAVQLTAELDDSFGSTQYQMIRRGFSAWQAEDVPFVVPAFVSGVPAASYLYAYVAAVPIFFPANFSGSKAKSQVAATGNTDIDVSVNGSSIGTITFGFGDAVAGFVTAGGTDQGANLGDIITFTFPASPDATLADIAISLKGLLQ